MRTIITAALLAAALTLAGCRSESPVTETPELSFVSANTVEASAEGGSYTVEYTVHNPSEDGVFSHKCQADWITGIKTGQNIMTFTVPANTAEEARKDGIVIIYDYISGKDSLTVNVTQAGVEPEPEPEPFSATFTVDSTAWNYAEITVVPNEPDAIYLTGYCTTEQYESFSSDEEVFAYRLYEISWFIENTQEILTKFGISGDYTATLSGLDELTDYTFYAFKIDLDLSNYPVLLSEVFETSFSTPEQELVDFSVELTLDLKGTNLELTAVPNDDGQYYYLDVFESYVLDMMYGGDIRSYVEGKVVSWLDFGMAESVADVPGVFQGRQTKQYTDLFSGSEYIAIAVGVDENGYPNSETVTKTFTPEAIISDAEVTYTPRCFDGTEVALKYPEQYGDAMGKVLIAFEKDFSENTSGYMWSIYDGDYSYLSGQELTNEIVNWGRDGDMSEERHIYISNAYGLTFTVLLVAYDADRNYGTPSATAYTFTQDDVLPIEQFVP